MLSHSEFEDSLVTARYAVDKACKGLKGYQEHFEDGYQTAVEKALLKGVSAFENVNKITMFLAATTHGYIASAGRLEAKQRIARAHAAQAFAYTGNAETEIHGKLEMEQALDGVKRPELIRDVLEGRMSYAKAAQEAGLTRQAIHQQAAKVRKRLKH